MELCQLLDAPLAFIRDHFWQLAPVSIAGMLLMAVPNMVTVAYTSGLQGSDFGSSASVLVVTYSSMFVLMLCFLAVHLATFAQVHAVMEGRPRGLGAALLQGFSPRRYLTLVIKYAIFVAGFCLCGLPQLYFGLVLAWLAAILVHEPETAWFAAIGRSVRLSHRSPRGGRLGNTIVRQIIAWHVIFALIGALNGVTSIPMFAFQGLDLWRGIMSGQAFDPQAFQAGVPLAISLPLTLLGSVISGIAYLYPAVLFTMLYRDVRDMSEGRDLEDALAVRLRRNVS